MDKSVIFGWIGVVALILAMPLSITANLLTPLLKDWWSATSRVRGLKRYKSLGRTISAIKRGGESAALASCLRLSLGGILTGILSLWGLMMLLTENEDFIAVKNGFQLDKPVSLESIYRLGLLTCLLSVISMLICEILVLMAIGQSELISTSRRRRSIARLKLKRRALRRRFGIVENSTRLTVHEPNSTI